MSLLSLPYRETTGVLSLNRSPEMLYLKVVSMSLLLSLSNSLRECATGCGTFSPFYVCTRFTT